MNNRDEYISPHDQLLNATPHEVENNEESQIDAEKIEAASTFDFQDNRDLYLDKLSNTEADDKEIQKVKESIMTAKDKRVIKLLWILNALVFSFIGVFLMLTDTADEYKAIKEEARYNADDVNATFYDASKVFEGKLTPNYKDVQYPDGILDGLKNLYSQNEHTAGWIRIDDTEIDHAVMQTDNHDDYLRHTFYKQYYVGGSIFMDYRNIVKKSRSSLSKNTIIYGHYLKNFRGMFSDLDKYMDVEYYKEHPVIQFSTLYNSYQWKIIGAFLAADDEKGDNSLFYYWCDNFSDEKTLGFANEVAFRSYFQNPTIDIKPTDKFLTLSTCSHLLDIGGMVNARFVVVARLVRDGESSFVDVSGAVDNPDRRMPQLWYDLNGLENPYSQYAIWQAF